MIDCGHGSGICDQCQTALDELMQLCEQNGLALDVVYVVSGAGGATE